MDKNLNKEEKELLESYKKGEWEKIPSHEDELKRYKELAQHLMKKDKRINIRLSERDLTEIKRKAVDEGIPYQTLVSSILHKYINGRLVETTEDAG